MPELLVRDRHISGASWQPDAMKIRPRTINDVEACAAMLSTIWDRDRYPIYLPDDVTAFVAPGDELGAWVAADTDDSVVGHVALHSRASEPVMDVVVQQLGCREEDVAVVARLMVAPSARRAGIALALLTHAARAATQLQRMPILDVAAHYHAAVALYEGAGWRRIGTALFRMPDGSSVTELVFTAPDR